MPAEDTPASSLRLWRTLSQSDRLALASEHRIRLNDADAEIRERVERVRRALGRIEVVEGAAKSEQAATAALGCGACVEALVRAFTSIRCTANR